VGTPVRAGHVRLGPVDCRWRLTIDEHQPLEIEVDLAVEPRLPALQDVGTVLLRGVPGLLLRARP
jgi:hypothetical protein